MGPKSRVLFSPSTATHTAKDICQRYVSAIRTCASLLEDVARCVVVPLLLAELHASRTRTLKPHVWSASSVLKALDLHIALVHLLRFPGVLIRFSFLAPN